MMNVSPESPSLAELHEVRRLGARDSTFRSADQTAAALFWHCAPPGLWTELAGMMLGQGGNPDFVTRGLGIVSPALTQARALVVAQAAQRPMARPIAFIRGTVASRLAASSLDPAWEPLVSSNRVEGFPSSSCVIGGTVVGLLRSLLGSDGHPILLPHEILRMTRPIGSLTSMLQEIEDSRVWGGTHLRTVAVESTEMGLRLARDLYRASVSPRSSRVRADSRA